MLLLGWLGSRERSKEERIWVMTGSGGVYSGPLEPLAGSRAFFAEAALVATQAALQWSPAGLDLPELVKIYFHPRAAAQVDEALKGQMEDVRARSLQTKPLIHSLSDPVADGEARVVEVQGVLARNGLFAGRLLYEEPSFRLNLRFLRNKDLAKAVQHPWVVGDFHLALGDTGGTVP